MAEQVYYVENIVRRQGSRLHRAKSAVRHRFKQFIGGQRLLRNKKMPLTEAQFMAEEEKIKALVQAGVLAVYMPDGTRITATIDGRQVKMPRGGRMVIEGQAPPAAPKKAEPVKVEATTAPKADPTVPEAPPQEDDLTTLPGVGAGRARKLNAEGLVNYKGVVMVGVEGLVKMLNVTEEVAEEIVEAAEEALS